MALNYSDPYNQRFGGIARLYGEAALGRLRAGHFVVIGLGGVGTWAAEALARTGVGEMTLVDLDDICITNTNRQVHALQSTIGQQKTTALANRLRDINPDITLHCVENFIDRKNLSDIILPQHHVVLDAMDSVFVKAGIVAFCSASKKRLVMAGASGGKRDGMALQCADLGEAKGDKMLAKVRSQLYRHFNFQREEKRKFRVDVVFSQEQMVYPKPDGTVCENKSFLASGVKLDCAGGFGSSVMVTGAFGFAMAQQGIKRYLQDAL